MRPKEIQKILVDVAMTAVLLCLMAYLLLGEALHEWLGVAMFGLWVFHHGLNWNWHKNLAKGRYTPLRLAQTGVDLLILLSMVGLMVSGVMMSREVFAFLPVRAGIGFAPAGLVLGLFVDRHPPRASLGHGDGEDTESSRHSDAHPPGHMAAAGTGCFAGRLWPICFYQT